MPLFKKSSAVVDSPEGKQEFSFPSFPGESLPNGTILIAESEPQIQQDIRVSIVLAVKSVGSVFEPYVTWRRQVHVLCDPNRFSLRDFCELGHYHISLETALADFKERS